MTDSRQLLQVLNQYQESLKKHHQRLSANFQQLDSHWRAFQQSAEGDYATQFETGWTRTREQFQLYIKQSQNVLILLNERTQMLQALNSAEENSPYAVQTGIASNSLITPPFTAPSADHANIKVTIPEYSKPLFSLTCLQKGFASVHLFVQFFVSLCGGMVPESSEVVHDSLFGYQKLDNQLEEAASSDYDSKRQKREEDLDIDCIISNTPTTSAPPDP